MTTSRLDSLGSKSALVLALLIVNGVVQPLRAQSCLRGRPLPRCESFWVSEFGWTPRMNEAPDLDKESFRYSLDLGRMKNTSRHLALGASAVFGVDDNGTRVGLKARARRWLTPAVSAGFAPGVILLATDNAVDNHLPGLMLEADLMLADIVGVTVHMERLSFDRRPNIPEMRESGTDMAWYGGLKLGSYAGLVGTVALAGFAAIAIACCY